MGWATIRSYGGVCIGQVMLGQVQRPTIVFLPLLFGWVSLLVRAWKGNLVYKKILKWVGQVLKDKIIPWPKQSRPSSSLARLLLLLNWLVVKLRSVIHSFQVAAYSLIFIMRIILITGGDSVDIYNYCSWLSFRRTPR